VDDALAADIGIEVVLVSKDREERAAGLRGRGIDVRIVEDRLLARASGLETSPGVLALCPAPEPVDPGSLRLDEGTLLLVAHGVADPGNLGALARSAEAFGARALLVTRGGASPWKPKALRGSTGSLLRVPVGHGMEGEELAARLAHLGVRQACAATRGGADPARFDWRGPLALWVGSETGELPAAARGFEALTIPMAGRVESLNVAVAASLLLHAAVQSRGSARDGR